jgi:ubiquitin-like protein ATG12
MDSGNNTTSITTTNEQDQEQPQPQQSKDAPISNIPSPDDKVKIHFVAVGSAPILKRTKFQISADQRFAAVHVFLRKLLKLPSIDNHSSSSSSSSSNTSSRNNLFLYCCSAFVPSPDHLVGELRDSFANVHTNELVIHYSIQEAWG